MENEDYYTLGYLLGDGGLQPKTHKRKARLYISSSDRELVEWMNIRYQPDSVIDSRIPVNKKRHIKSKKKSYKFSFSSKYSEWFMKYHLLSKKEKRDIVNIPKVKMRYFLLGFFDADGYITWGRRKDRNRLWCNVGFANPNLKVLQKIQKFMEEELDISSRISPKPNEECYRLVFSNRKKTFLFMKWLYDCNIEYSHYRKRKAFSEYAKEIAKEKII